MIGFFYTYTDRYFFVSDDFFTVRLVFFIR